MINKFLIKLNRVQGTPIVKVDHYVIFPHGGYATIYYYYYLPAVDSEGAERMGHRVSTIIKRPDFSDSEFLYYATDNQVKLIRPLY
jgi:hypothetical protein